MGTLAGTGQAPASSVASDTGWAAGPERRASALECVGHSGTWRPHGTGDSKNSIASSNRRAPPGSVAPSSARGGAGDGHGQRRAGRQHQQASVIAAPVDQHAPAPAGATGARARCRLSVVYRQYRRQRRHHQDGKSPPPPAPWPLPRTASDSPAPGARCCRHQGCR